MSMCPFLIRPSFFALTYAIIGQETGHGNIDLLKCRSVDLLIFSVFGGPENWGANGLDGEKKLGHANNIDYKDCNKYLLKFSFMQMASKSVQINS